MSTIDLHLLTGAYAVDALTGDELVEFEAHLPECPECTAEVAELRETAARLAVLSAETPPESLRANVLTGISSVRQLPPTAVDGAAVDGDSNEPDDDSRDAVVLPAIGRPGSAWARKLVMPVAAALLGVLALSLGAWGVHQRDRADQLSATASLVSSVLTAPDATSSSTRMGTGRASLVVSATDGKAVMVGTGLSAPGEGKAYQLWRVDQSGHASSGGVYTPSANGGIAVVVDGSLAGTKTIAVTVEPSGGSQQPTSAPIGSFPVA